MHRVGPKGTVVIEQDIRKRLGIEPGVEVLQEVVDGSVVLTFLPPREAGIACGILSIDDLPEKVRARTRTDEGLEEVIKEATEEYFEARARYLAEL